MSNIDKQWRVQVKGVNGEWRSKGLFETRERARLAAQILRPGFGFGNTRVIPYVKEGAK